MKIKHKLRIVFLSAALTAASWSCQPTIEPPVSSRVLQADKPVEIENAGLTGWPAVTAVSSPGYRDSNPSATPVWQVCTWNLYGIFTTTSAIHAGKPMTVGAYLYIEDFPTTDVDTELIVNNVEVERQTVSVNFDEAWPFYFSCIPDKPGDYNITIRAILHMNAALANEPGGGNNYYSVSTIITVPG